MARERDGALSPMERLAERPEELLPALALGLFLLAPLPIAVLDVLGNNRDASLLVFPKLVYLGVLPLSLCATAAGAFLTLRGAREAGRLAEALRRHPCLWFFALAGAWMGIATCVTGLTDLALHGALMLDETFYLQMWYMLVLVPCAALVRDRELKRLLLNAHVAVSVVLVGAAFALANDGVTLVGVPWRGDVSSALGDFSSIYFHHNYYAYYLATAIPAAASLFVSEERRAWQALYAGALLANTAALAVNGTMGGWVACAFALVFLLVAHGMIECRVNRRVVIAAALFVACLVGVASLVDGFSDNIATFARDVATVARDVTGVGAADAAGESENAAAEPAAGDAADSSSADAAEVGDASAASAVPDSVPTVVASSPGESAVDEAGSGRWGIWTACVGLIAERPLFGYGMEGIMARDLVEEARNPRPHNEYLQYALFYGIPAVAAYLAGCVGMYARAVRRRQRLSPESLAALAAAFGYLVSATFGNTLYCTAPLVFLFLGLGYRDER